jgi:hypothetical protein
MNLVLPINVLDKLPKRHISNLMEEKLAEGPAHCNRHGGHAPSRLPAQVTTANEGEKMGSLGFKDGGRYFIPANRSEGHVGYMRAHAADLARAANSNFV